MREEPGYRTPTNAKEANAIIRAIKMEIEAKSYPDTMRTGSAEEAAAHVEGKRAAQSALAVYETTGHGINEVAAEFLTRERYEANCQFFARQMTALIPDAAARDHAIAHYREAQRQYVREA